MWILTLCALLGAAPDWSTTFETGATASYLDRPNAAVMVVSAGPRSESQAAAERALVSALRASGRTRLVMASESLAVSPEDADEVVVKKAAPLPVDAVVVLRLFPGTTETAVATVYDKAGVALSAMSGLKGQVLARKEGASQQIAGRTAVVETIEQSSRRDTHEKVDGAFRDAGKIEFSAGVLAHTRKGRELRRWDAPYFQNKRLDGARFYDVVGRADLASAYRGRVGARVGLMAGGGALMLAGALMAVLTYNPDCAVFNGATRYCLQYRTPSLVVPGLIGAGLGLAAFITGAALPSDPVGPQERFELAQEFNRTVDEKKAPVSSRTTGAPQVVFGFAPTPGGAAASFAVTF